MVLISSLFRFQLPATIEEETDQPRFCRVIMPDGSTTVVGTKQGQTINYILGKLCEKRGLSIATVDVFLLGSDKVRWSFGLGLIKSQSEQFLQLSNAVQALLFVLFKWNF